MSLIKSISGIRGTVGGKEGDNLTCLDVVRFTAAYAQFLLNTNPDGKRLVVVGRDARVSGPMVSALVCNALCGMGFDVVDIGLASTPTTELAVTGEGASGGIIITASHNPAQWNALKLLGPAGEFLSNAEGKEVLRLAASDEITYATWDNLGAIEHNDTYDRRHIEAVMALPLVDVEAIRRANLRVAIDAVNSVGGRIMPRLLRALGVAEVIELNCEATGRFAHTPEPIPENLRLTARTIVDSKADVGLVVDPDVDRLAIIMENGEMFVEEYTLVSVADYVLGHTPGNTVSNLSSSRALRDVTNRHADCSYSAAAVGEVNVVAEMKRVNAVIGGESSGGLAVRGHIAGKDGIYAAALLVEMLAVTGKSVSQLYQEITDKYGMLYYEDAAFTMTQARKVELQEKLFVKLEVPDFGNAVEKINRTDGCKVYFTDGSWVICRFSGTEPLLRMAAEGETQSQARTYIRIWREALGL